LLCRECGKRNPGGTRYCLNCGRPLAETLPATPVTQALQIEGTEFEDLVVQQDDLDQGSAALIVQRGPGAGNRFLLGPGMSRCGRSAESDIFLDDITVSRHHAEIRAEQTTYWLTDVGSFNGTYLNGRRIDNSLLTDRDVIQIGKFRLIFVRP
jgi:hypothetical protein